jgi:hypothetical protein
LNGTPIADRIGTPGTSPGYHSEGTTMARQVSGDGYAVYYDTYDTGERDTLDFATVEVSRHSVIRRRDGATVATIVATWGDHSLIRLQASGMVTDGMLDLAQWNMTDDGEQAEKEYQIVPPIG